MTSSLESQLREELRDEAGQVREPADLAARVLARGHAVRRRRAQAASAVAGLAAAGVLAVVVASGLPGTSSAPPAHHTSEPSPEATLSDGLRRLPAGALPQLDYIVGSTAHLGGQTVRLPADWVVTNLVRASDRWVMVAETARENLVASINDAGVLRELDREDALGLAVDPTGRYVAWGSEQRRTVSTEHLTAYDLMTDSVLARHEFHQPVQVQGWAEEGVIASYRMTPGGSPVVWDPVADTLTKVWGGTGEGPTFVAHSARGPRWLLVAPSTSCGVVIAHVGDKAPVSACEHGLGAPAVFFESGGDIAVTADGAVRVLDRTLADTGEAHPIPDGAVPLQIVAIGRSQLLVVIAGSGDRAWHVLRCVGNGPCERALDSDPDQRVTLVTP